MSADHSRPDNRETLGVRIGLPSDLRVLRERFPRECWYSHANLGSMARFWMSRHDMFRELGAALGSATSGFLGGGLAAREFTGWFAPRLQFLLSHLGTHHQIEDYHYFPIFRVADARLARGFDLLENDHHVIHAAMDRTVTAANALLGTLAAGGDDLWRAGEAYAEASDPLLRLLLAHLDDEEDLIVPLILDRGEDALGVGH
jgi:hypothetical protein